MNRLLFSLMMAWPVFSYAQLEVSLIPDSLLIKADAVIRYDRSICTIKAIDEFELEQEVAVTVLNKDGEVAAQINIPYNEGGEKIKDLKIEIDNKEGKTIKKVKNKEIDDYSSSDGFSLASDNRYKHYRYVPNSYPYTVRYSYKIKSNNTFIIPNWYPIRRYQTSIQESSYEIVNNVTNLLLDKKEYNLDAFGISNAKDWLFTASNIKAIEYEKNSTHFLAFAPHIRVLPTHFNYYDQEGSITDWASYGKWMHDKMLSGRGSLPKALIDEMDKLISSNMSVEEKAKVIYKYVTKNNRYVSIQLGIGGLLPFDCKKVYDLKYGDCKALSFYTQQLLEHYGIASIYTEIKFDSSYDFSYDDHLPGVDQGNHIILCLPTAADTIWLECTAETMFGYTHDGICNRQVLLIKPEGGELVRTQSYTSNENRVDHQIRIYLEEEKFMVDLKNNYFNQRHENWGSYLKKNSKELYKSISTDIYPLLTKMEIKSYTLTADSSQFSVEENGLFDITQSIEHAGSYTMIPLHFIHVPERNVLPSKRARSIYIKDPKKDFYNIEINIPEGKTVVVDEKKHIQFENDFGIISSILELLSDDKARLTINIIRNNGTFSPDKVLAFNEYVEYLEKLQSTKIVLKPKN